MSGKENNVLDRALLQDLIQGCPFHRFLGIELEEYSTDAGTITLSVTARDTFSRSNSHVELHGGVIAALIDIAGDYAVALRVGQGVPTINLRTDFLRLARGKKATATARLVRCGRSIAVVDIDVVDETGQLVAVGRGTYSSATHT